MKTRSKYSVQFCLQLSMVAKEIDGIKISPCFADEHGEQGQQAET